MKVGFIGLGRMDQGMAGRLLSAGHHLLVHDPIPGQVEPAVFFDVMLQGLFGAPAYQIYGKMIVDEAWEGHGATAVIGLKDADLALEAADAADMPLPSANIWRNYLQSAIDRGEGSLDWAVMAREQARASGLDK